MFRRSDSPRLALESLVPHEQAFRRSLADEVAIDFPSSQAAIEYFRRDHIEAGSTLAPVEAAITVSAAQAAAGALVPLDVVVPRTCGCCGGRGEVWSDPCASCDGRGHQAHRERLLVAVPRGVADGDRFSFSVQPPRGPRSRVDVRVAVVS